MSTKQDKNKSESVNVVQYQNLEIPIQEVSKYYKHNFQTPLTSKPT